MFRFHPLGAVVGRVCPSARPCPRAGSAAYDWPSGAWASFPLPLALFRSAWGFSPGFRVVRGYSPTLTRLVPSRSLALSHHPFLSLRFGSRRVCLSCWSHFPAPGGPSWSGLSITFPTALAPLALRLLPSRSTLRLRSWAPFPWQARSLSGPLPGILGSTVLRLPRRRCALRVAPRLTIDVPTSRVPSSASPVLPAWLSLPCGHVPCRPCRVASLPLAWRPPFTTLPGSPGCPLRLLASGPLF